MYIFWLCIPMRPLFRLMLFHKELILTLICLLIFVKFLLIICRDSYSLGFNLLNFRFQLLMCLWLFKLIELLLRLMIVKRGAFLKHSSQQICTFELLLDFIIFFLLWNFIITIIRHAWLTIYWQLILCSNLADKGLCFLLLYRGFFHLVKNCHFINLLFRRLSTLIFLLFLFLNLLNSWFTPR